MRKYKDGFSDSDQSLIFFAFKIRWAITKVVSVSLLVQQPIDFLPIKMYILCRVTELLFIMFTQDVYKLKSIGSLHNQNNEQS